MGALREDGILDDVAIERRLAGDRTVRLTTRERHELVLRAIARGWSRNQIDRIAGIHAERYVPSEHPRRRRQRASAAA